MEKHTKFSIWYVLAAIWGMLLIQDFIASQYRPIALPYSEFLKSLQAGDIIEVVITQDRISGKMKVTENQQPREVNFVTIRVDPELSNELAKHNVRSTAAGVDVPAGPSLLDLARSHLLRHLVPCHEEVEPRGGYYDLREKQGQALRRKGS